MSITSTPAAPRPAPVGEDDLRIVLFGLPEAGKSSLLGALGEASLGQEHLLGGHLVDETGGLSSLAKTLYEGPGRRTAEEVVPYPVRYEPPEGAKLDAVIMDCDGRVANDLLASKQSLDAAKGKLASEVADADALLLVIDAAATPAQIEADFVEFDRFLKMVEETRGEATEVAGMPVFLVLTKCDLLAQPADSMADWMDRIEQRKRDVDGRFRDFLARRLGDEETSAPVLAFGRIDLHVWATAVKKPTLVGAAARPREPYGVAELFRQCLTEAAGHRRREERSGRKLAWLTAVALGLFLSLVGLTGVFLAVNHATATNALAGRVDDLRYLDRDTPSERLRGSLDDLRRRERLLEGFRKDPGYASLKPDLRGWVEERLTEVTGYVAYLDKLLGERSPASERSEEALTAQVERLKGPLAVPDAEWEATPAGQRRKDLLDTAEAIQKGVQKARFHYEDERESIVRELLTERDAASTEWAGWAARAEKLLSGGARPPFRPADPLPGAAGLTYETVLRYDRVLTARSGYEADRDRLRRLLDVTSALGLAPASEGRPAVLAFGRGFTLAQARERLAQLEKAYPEAKATFAREGLPLPALQRAVRSQYENLLAPARAEVLRQLKAGGSGREETTKRWDAVRSWLKEPTELAAWRQLALLLLRMEDPAADDPVTALGAFLNREAFDLSLDSVVVEIPQGRALTPRADSPFELHLGDRTLTFRPSGEPRKDEERRAVQYTFRGDGASLRYHPGDKLWARLPLRGGAQVLTWSESRSSLYQFERLRQPPRLQPEGAELSDGRLLDDVKLIVRPAGGVPAVPDLLPAARLEE